MLIRSKLQYSWHIIQWGRASSELWQCFLWTHCLDAVYSYLWSFHWLYRAALLFDATSGNYLFAKCKFAHQHLLCLCKKSKQVFISWDIEMLQGCTAKTVVLIIISGDNYYNYLRLLFNDQIPTISPCFNVFLRLIHYFLSEVMHTIASGRQYEDLNLVLLRCCFTAVRNGGETLFLVLNSCASLQIF